MLVYIDDMEDEEFHSDYKNTYVYENDANYGYDYGGEEDSNKCSYDYEIHYVISEDCYLVS